MDKTYYAYTDKFDPQSTFIKSFYYNGAERSLLAEYANGNFRFYKYLGVNVSDWESLVTDCTVRGGSYYSFKQLLNRLGIVHSARYPLDKLTPITSPYIAAQARKSDPDKDRDPRILPAEKYSYTFTIDLTLEDGNTTSVSQTVVLDKPISGARFGFERS